MQTKLFASMFPQAAATTGDGKTAIQREQKIRGSRDWRSATFKKSIQIMGAPLALTPGEQKALDDEAFNMSVDSLSQPKREDRDYAGNPKSPGLPEKPGPLGRSWSIAIGREKDRFIQKSIARETITSIMNRAHPDSAAFFNPLHPDHADVVANVYSVREILNAD